MRVSHALDKLGPVVDVLVLMMPGMTNTQAAMDARTSEFVRDVFAVCAEKQYSPPHVLWCADARAQSGYVVMDARLDKDTLRKLWHHGKVYGQAYRLHSPKERRDLEAWMAGRAPAERWEG